MDRAVAEHALTVLWEHMHSLRPLLEADGVQEVMLNTPSEVWAERNGTMQLVPDVEFGADQVDAVIRILANLNGKPDADVLDCRLPGLRIAAARHPVAMRGHSMCIRRHMARKLTLSDYVESGAFDRATGHVEVDAVRIPSSISERMAEGGDALASFLVWAVRAGRNIVVSGSTSSGKTTLVGALLDCVPTGDRLITIEDTGELSELHFALPNRVHFEAVGVSIRDLVRLSLRYRPSRVIVGEIRGAEGFDLMRAYNTGHRGGIVTLHADSATSALQGLETMVRMAPEGKELPLDALRRQIADTFDYVIHAANTPGLSAARAPIEVISVDGVSEGGLYQTSRLYSRF